MRILNLKLNMKIKGTILGIKFLKKSLDRNPLIKEAKLVIKDDILEVIGEQKILDIIKIIAEARGTKIIIP